MLNRLQTRDLLKARLSRYIATWVFASIILIEVVILVPSYFRQRQELLDALEGVSQEVLTPILLNEMYQKMGSQQLVEKLNQRRKPNSVILGGALYTPAGQLLGTFGEPPELNFQQWGNKTMIRQHYQQGDRYDVAWLGPSLKSKFVLIVRHDSSSVQPSLNAFIGRIALLVLLIAAFVTLATMVTLGITVITPILRLRDDLIAAGETLSSDLATPHFSSLQTKRRDELGEVITAFTEMFHRVRQEIWTRQAAEQLLRTEQEKSERLLLNILPAAIAEQLKQDLSPIACRFEEVTILFADLVRFTELSTKISPVELVDQLNQIFSNFDHLAEKHGLEKIKTIGDAYMVVGGLPTPRADHAEAIARMALEMQAVISKFQTANGDTFQLRIGINTGTVVAGVIGKKKFSYDLWGDAVNLASRMESHGMPDKIQVTQATYHHLKERFSLTERGPIQVKGRGEVITYWLLAETRLV